MIRVGLISDTHGLLRPAAIEYLRNCDRIVHAGDIGNAGILDELAAIAPVTAVRGNNDSGPWARSLAESQIVGVEQIFVYVVHDIGHIDIDPGAAGVRVVVTGHSHRPSTQERNGILYVNPGSAGPRRFALPVCAGELVVDGMHVSARVVELEPS